jgi:DNA-directed RNA polymerase specialized sigma24 family protein
MSSRLGSQFWTILEDSPLGQKIWEAVRRTWVSALRYAQRSVRDPAVVADCLEDAAASVLRANRENLERIQNLDAYLLRAFAREIARHVARESRLVGMEYAEQIAAPSHPDTFSEVLAKELIAMMNPRMRMLFERRAEGYSWDEIGRDLRIDPHIAKQQFSFGLRTLAERINKPTVPDKNKDDKRRSQSVISQRRNQKLDKSLQGKNK